MEEKKYYTPAIEEFHVGFEYEYKSENGKYSTFANSKGEWIKKTFENEAEYGMEELTEFQSIESALQNEYKRYGDVRVKYLDKEDIEALGWKHIKTGDEYSNNSLHFQLVTDKESTSPTVHDLRFEPNNPTLITLVIWDNGSWGRNERKMDFSIKNKSELKKLMELARIRERFIAKVKG